MYRLALALIGLVVLLLGFFLYREQAMTPRYESAAYGFSFSYPEGYVLSESEVGSGYHAIRLLREEDATPPEGGEGPTGVAVDVYQNQASSLLEWMQTSSVSNYQLGNKAYEPTSVAGVPAFRYRWSGLYEGETVAFLLGGNVIAVSVTRLSPEEHAEAYQEVLSSFKLR